MNYVPAVSGDGVGADDAIMEAVDVLARETMLFASIGFLIGGIDDLLVDLAYLAARLRAWLRPVPQPALSQAAPPLAIFIPAWEEEAVIAPMLRAALVRYDYAAYRIYVGTYPNDTPTIAAVEAVAKSDARIRLVIGAKPGPTTKADCLNTLWAALLADEAAGDEVRAVVLHDAEDLVHPDELRVFATCLDTHDAVQLPVLPLADRHSPLIAGHYLDEFAEAHMLLAA